MDIRVVCLVHSEDDIWAETLARLVALFNHVYVVVQTPTNRIPAVTSAVQQRHPRAVSSYVLAQNGNFRSEVSKLFASLAFSQGADWVLFADGDEFIRATSRSDLEGVLSGRENSVVNFRRRNDAGKVAISAGWASRFPQFELTSNVTAVAPWSGAMPISGPTVGEGSITETEATAAVHQTVETSSWRPAPMTSGKRLALLSGTTVEIGLQPVSGRGAARGSRFGTLARRVQPRLDQGRLNDAIGAAFQHIETPLAGDAAIHVPALFFLWRLLAPRRYVELGSRQGMTFFAACQAAKGQGETAECIAVDSWDGEGDKLFADFAFLLSTRYPHVGHYVRGQVDDAAWCFEDGSIDLLYIDGCREDAAVKHDFDTWLPKMSDRGVMLLHGTANGENDPGAGDPWTEIEAKHSSWNLRIGRGLGVVYVGDPETEATRLLAQLRENAAWSEALTEMARGAASLSLAEARRAVAQVVSSRGEITKERLSREREAAAKQATSKMRASLSWRLTAPLRLAGRLFRGTRGSRNE